jgi:acetyltransferase-like isoleucine patch superfamily enzyme
MKIAVLKAVRCALYLVGMADIFFSKFMHYIHAGRSIARKVYLFPNMRGGWVDCRSEIKFPENITIGNDCVVSLCTIGAKAKIQIGSNVTISKGAVIETGSLTRQGQARHKALPIQIGNRAWIAAHAIVLGGSIIEEDCIVGAGVVFKGHLKQGEIVTRSSIR